jgi:hypothetical protein
VVPVYSGRAPDSSGRTFDQAPSAPTSRLVVAAVAQRRDRGQLLAPLDRPGGQGFEQDPPQVAAEHLGTPAGAVVGLLEQQGAVRVEHAGGLGALVDDGVELVGEAGRGQGGLPVVLVQVELAALGPGLRRRLRLVDRGRDAVDVQDAGQGEAAQARPDDCDRCCHGAPLTE